MRAGDENRLTGYAALPFNLNPYLKIFRQPVPVAGAIMPAAGSYDIVFDTPADGQPGAFTFRLWIGDTTPPALQLPVRTVRRGALLSVRATARARASTPPRSSCGSTAASARPGSPPAASSWRRTD